MPTTESSTAKAPEPATGNIPENVHLRESRDADNDDSKGVLATVAPRANTRFRESLNQPPRKPTNAERRSREYLTPGEVERLIKSAEQVGRHGHRDGTILLVTYRHGLRVSEVCSLRWDQVDLGQGMLHVRRAKNGTPQHASVARSRIEIVETVAAGLSGLPLRLHRRAQGAAHGIDREEDCR